MYKHLFVTLTVVAVVALLAPSPAAAAGQCSSVCTPSTQCWKLCRDGYGEESFTTCGEYGICDDGGGGGGGGGCTPNYQVISTTAIGSFQVNYYSPTTHCDFIVLYQNTWHDQNQCAGSSDYTTCFYQTQASRPDLFCCYYYYCFGQTTCS